VARGTPTATPGINQHNPLDRLTPTLPKKTQPNKETKNKTKKTLNNKQGTEKDMQQRERVGCFEHTGEGERNKELLSARIFNKQGCKSRWLTSLSCRREEEQLSM
jgi:hypothetical protein